MNVIIAIKYSSQKNHL